MGDLRRKKYDLVLTDPVWGAGIILAHALELPLVYNVRWVTSGEGHLTITPSPLSYIPMTCSRLTDKMTFIERVKNLLFYVLWEIQDMLFICPQYQTVCDQFFGPDVKYTHLLQGADLWLMIVDFVFEFPRPTMPNVVYVGGFHCKPSKPLTEHLEKFKITRPSTVKKYNLCILEVQISRPVCTQECSTSLVNKHHISSGSYQPPEDMTLLQSGPTLI
uniref:UDP glucuronosyltransferase 5 family, polypeptide D1 n=1 Tax=Oryzias latipes TaxID=8090 RepID=A0A3P9JPQ3_ORYLA